jgi:RNA polymerase sigma-70 factor, ECF subfamily
MRSDEATRLLLQNRRHLIAFADVILKDFHRAEDVFQEVCVKVLGRVEDFSSPEHLIKWCYAASRNRAIDLVRNKNVEQRAFRDELLAILIDEWPARHEGNLSMEALSACMAKLTKNNREVLRLRYFESQTGIEVAAILNRKVETVYRMLTRIHKLLADCVRQHLLQGDVS